MTLLVLVVSYVVHILVHIQWVPYDFTPPPPPLSYIKRAFFVGSYRFVKSPINGLTSFAVCSMQGKMKPYKKTPEWTQFFIHKQLTLLLSSTFSLHSQFLFYTSKQHWTGKSQTKCRVICQAVRSSQSNCLPKAKGRLLQECPTHWALPRVKTYENVFHFPPLIHIPGGYHEKK